LSPGFIFFPSDLQYFINFEKSDFDRRKRLYQNNGRLPARTAPMPQDYRQFQIANTSIAETSIGGLYRRLVLRDYMQSRLFPIPLSQLYLRTGELHQPAEWHGDPMAALGQAFHALSSVSTVIEIPRPIRTTLQELLNLYIENDEDLAAEFAGLQGITTSSTSSDSRTLEEIPDRAHSLPPTIVQHGADDVQDCDVQARAIRDEAQPGPIGNPNAVDKSGMSASSDRFSSAIANDVVSASVLRWLASFEPDLSRSNGYNSEDRLSHLPAMFDDNTSSATSELFRSVHQFDSEVVRKKSRERYQISSWKWDPDATANDVVDFYVGIRNTCGRYPEAFFKLHDVPKTMRLKPCDACNY